MRTVTALVLLFNVLGCGAAVQSHLIKKDLHLRDYKKVHLSVAVGGSAISVTGAGIGSGFARVGRASSSGSVSSVGSTLSVSHTMSGDDQILMAAQDIALSLQEIGFDLADKPEDADTLLLFSIGTVRYDPLADWIADRAFLQFKDRKAGSTICSIKADGQVITPTLRTLVDNLVAEVKRFY